MCMHLKRKLQNWLSKIDKPTELKRHRKLTITVNDSNISLLVINTRRYKFYKNIEDLINIINLLDVFNKLEGPNTTRDKPRLPQGREDGATEPRMYTVGAPARRTRRTRRSVPQAVPIPPELAPCAA